MDLDEEKPKNRPYANYIFVFSNLLIFVICTFTGEWLYNIGIMKPLEIVEDGQWYRMITSMFLHADTDHVIGNMMLLFFLGEVVERNLGHIKYFVLYMLAGIAGNVLSLLYSLW